MPDTQLALKLIYRAHIFVVNSTHPTLQMGRDDGNEIVIVSLFASRVHASVQTRDGKLVLTDLSSNGTFILLDEPAGPHSDAESAIPANEIRLRQAEAVLSGRGWLGLGRSATTHGEHSVRFSVEAEMG